MSTWHGWLWDTRRQRWERVCSAPTLGACASQLGRIGGRRGIPARWQVMTGGGPPTWTPRKASGDATRASGASGKHQGDCAPPDPASVHPASSCASEDPPP
jgi:hypothetical protein